MIMGLISVLFIIIIIWVLVSFLLAIAFGMFARGIENTSDSDAMHADNEFKSEQ